MRLKEPTAVDNITKKFVQYDTMRYWQAFPDAAFYSNTTLEISIPPTHSGFWRIKVWKLELTNHKYHTRIYNILHGTNCEASYKFNSQIMNKPITRACVSCCRKFRKFSSQIPNKMLITNKLLEM